LQRKFKGSISKNIAAYEKIRSEHNDINFIKIDPHLEKLWKETKGDPI